jgi:ferredoxin-NADP reductase/fatty acid desaturase
VGPRVRGALPDPGERVPTLALPTAAIYAGALTTWGLATWAFLAHAVTPWLTVPVHAAAGFVMFTVLHDAVHYSISSTRWVNGLFGRLAAPFVAIYMSFPLFKFIHIQHHRFANEDPDTDPDHYTSVGPWWQLPFRWLTIDVWYARFYVQNRRRLPAADARESAAVVVLALAGIAAATAMGALWEVAAIVLIPQRIQLGVLAWWFDWLPHHGLGRTQRENRYQATRIRVGLEWLMTPLMLSQNYHLVHHLHPSIPFYRYVRAWRHNEEGYLQHQPAMATVFGQAISADEYRTLRETESRLAQMLPVRIPEGTASPHGIFHKLRVAAIDRPGGDSVAIEFEVPDELERYFRFEPGQHLTVRSDHGGEGVRRNYSLCTSATTGELRIAVKRIPDGAFSSYVAEQLEVGDELEVMTPTGSFGPRLDPSRARHYAAIAGGSGITPIISIVETALAVESDSSFTVVYVNRSRETTMFRDRLDELVARYADRLEVLHVLTREEQRDPLLNGRLDADRLARLREERFPADAVDEWFVCGPPGLVDGVHGALLDSGADPGDVQVELFQAPPGGGHGAADADPSEVTIRLGGEEETFELAGGDTVLDGALEVREDAPYSCREGVCGTCRAKLVDGDGEMERNYALKKDEVDEGYVLTCQLRPSTEKLTVDYDA